MKTNCDFFVNKQTAFGKCDCHIHAALGGEDWRGDIARNRLGADENLLRRMLQTYRDAGYTHLRDGGDRWGISQRARALAPEYGIVYKTPLSPLCKAGHYGSFIGTPWENLQDYARLVKQQRQQGADFIKLMISGLMDFNRYGVLTEPGLEAHEIRELIHIAGEEGFGVMLHCNGPRTAEAAAEAGADSIEHGAYLDIYALEAMKENNVIWVPTLSTIARIRGTGLFTEAALTKLLEGAMENVAQFAALGGLVATGSDAGARMVFHGADTEEKLLVAAGVDTHLQELANITIFQRF